MGADQRRLADLDVDVVATDLAGGVQLVAQLQQRGRLAGLARRVQDEVLPLPDEQPHVVGIEPFEGRDVVVPVAPNRPGGVEEPHRSEYCTRPGTAAGPWAVPAAVTWARG